MAEYISEGEAPVLMIRLLRDSDNFELLQMVLEGRAGHGNVAALSKKVVKNLLLVDPPKNEECAVCLKKYDAKDQCIIMPCQHKFHQNCLFTWLKRINSCPMCRKEIPTDDPDYEAIRNHKEGEED